MSSTSIRGYCFSVLFLVLSILSVMQYGVMEASYHGHYYQSQSMCTEIQLRNLIETSPPGSQKYVEAKKELDDILTTIKRENDNFGRIENILLKNKKSSQVKKNDNVKYTKFNNCRLSLMDIYDKHCGYLSIHGSGHGEDIDNMCDAGVTESEMTEASIEACNST